MEIRRVLSSFIRAASATPLIVIWGRYLGWARLMILLAPALASPALFSIKLPALAGSAAGFAAITPIGAAGPRAPKAAIASQPPIVLLPNAGTGLFAKVQIQIIIPSVPENAFTALGGNLRKKAIRANTAGSITDQGGNTAIPASAQVQSTQLRAIRL